MVKDSLTPGILPTLRRQINLLNGKKGPEAPLRKKTVTLGYDLPV
jgi:hypothetical protein